ncbi:hypothetical protein E6H21_05435 [Candidatus Bathyarchaeota archaeon]|nr:MAG: hypothetical protein E6H21_05435 [Candidatus Bathyarchaeota archaeon]
MVSGCLKVARRFIGLFLFVMVGGVAFALAASNIITLNHTATIVQGATLGVTDIGPSAPTSCPSASTSYGPGPVGIVWGPLAAGATVKHYVCVINTGSAPDTITVSGSPPSGYGTISSPENSMILTPASTLAIELDWAIPTGATLGPVPAFATSIT